MNELNPPKGLGFIVRTAGLDRDQERAARDLAYLLRLWKVIVRRIKKAKAPAPIYQETDMITRTIRDIFTADIDTIWIDEPAAFERAQEFLQIVMPRYVDRLKLYDEKEPLFHKYGIEDEIAKIQQPARAAAATAARSSSTRPRPWWPSTSTAATSGPRTTPRRRPTR